MTHWKFNLTFDPTALINLLIRFLVILLGWHFIIAPMFSVAMLTLSQVIGLTIFTLLLETKLMVTAS